MTFFDEVKQQVEAFCEERENAMDSYTIAVQCEFMDSGDPPFVLSVGDHCCAVVFADGKVSPLPFGYQIDNNDIDSDRVYRAYQNIRGREIALYIPMNADFETPGEDAFCLENAQDSETWQIVEEGVEEFRKIINGLARTKFIESFAFGVSGVRKGDSIESLDQAITATLSIATTCCLWSYTKALRKLKDDNPQFDTGDE